MILELHDLRRRITAWFSFHFLVVGHLHRSILRVESAWTDSHLLKEYWYCCQRTFLCFLHLRIVAKAGVYFYFVHSLHNLVFDAPAALDVLSVLLLLQQLKDQLSLAQMLDWNYQRYYLLSSTGLQDFLWPHFMQKHHFWSICSVELQILIDQVVLAMDNAMHFGHGHLLVGHHCGLWYHLDFLNPHHRIFLYSEWVMY